VAHEHEAVNDINLLFQLLDESLDSCRFDSLGFVETARQWRGGRNARGIAEERRDTEQNDLQTVHDWWGLVSTEARGRDAVKKAGETDDRGRKT